MTSIVAYDIETHGLGGEACFVSWCDEHGAHGQKLNGDDQFTLFFIDHFLNEQRDKHVFIAHNAFGFDLKRLNWKMLLDRGYTAKLFMAKNNLVRGIDIKRDKYCWKLRDSFAFFPGSLEEFAKSFGIERKAKIDNVAAFDASNKKHIEYAIQDSRALYSAFDSFRKLGKRYFNRDPAESMTISSYALKVALNHIDPSYLPDSLNDAVRSSYHGGMTCAFRVGEFRDCIYLDINSAYAHVMRAFPMPAGRPILTRTPQGRAALWYAEIEIGEEFPFLFSERDGDMGRFAGRVSGWYWDFELEMQESLGSRVKRIIAISWPEEVNGLADFVRRCETLRHEDYHGPLGKLAKIVQNSAYGKFGAALHYRDVIMTPDPPDGYMPFLDHAGEVLEGFWWRDRESRGRSLVHWASYITARVRWQLMRYLLRVPRDEWIYCDTDSLIVPARYLSRFSEDIGEEYGMLKLEGEIERMRVEAPKVYCARFANGKEIFRAKGIPKRHVEEAYRHGAVEFEGSTGFIQIMRGKLLDRFDGRYTRITSRKLSTSDSVRVGFYHQNTWHAFCIDSPARLETFKLGQYAIVLEQALTAN